MSLAERVRPTVAALSDVGCRRSSNQDAYVVLELPLSAEGHVPLLFAAVADGMGGYIGGAEASAAVVRAAHEQLAQSPPPGPEEVITFLRETFLAAEEAVASSRHGDDIGLQGGTTFTAAVLWGERLWVGHVGDSRAYLIYNDRTEQLTEDDVVFADVEQTEGEGNVGPQCPRSALTRAIGRGVDGGLWQPQLHERKLPREGHLLLCSDGLHQYFQQDEIGEVIRTTLSTQDACRELVEEARRRGGADNITAVLIRILRVSTCVLVSELPQSQTEAKPNRPRIALTSLGARLWLGFGVSVTVFSLLTAQLLSMGLGDADTGEMEFEYREQNGRPEFRWKAGERALTVRQLGRPGNGRFSVSVREGPKGYVIASPDRHIRVRVDGVSKLTNSQGTVGPVRVNREMRIVTSDKRELHLVFGGGGRPNAR